LLGSAHQVDKHAGKRLAAGQQLEHMGAELIVPFGTFRFADVDEGANDLVQGAICCPFRFGAHQQPDAVMQRRAIDAHDDILHRLSRGNGQGDRMSGAREGGAVFVDNVPVGIETGLAEQLVFVEVEQLKRNPVALDDFRIR